MTTILGIAGSFRRDSFNRKLLAAAADLGDVDLQTWHGLAALPHFSEDDEQSVPCEVETLRAAIAAADGVLIATPEYNGSVPGVLKNAVDWASRPYGAGVLKDAPVAVIGASVTPYGAAWAQRDLRRALGIAGARVVETELAVGDAPQRFDERGALIGVDLRDQLRAVLDDLSDLAGAQAAA